MSETEEDFYIRALDYLSGNDSNSKSFMDSVKEESREDEFEKIKHEYIHFCRAMRVAKSIESSGSVNQRLKREFIEDKFPTTISETNAKLSLFEQLKSFFNRKDFFIYQVSAIGLIALCFIIFKQSNNSTTEIFTQEIVETNSLKNVEDLGITMETNGISELLNFAFIKMPLNLSREAETKHTILAPRGKTNFKNVKIIWTGDESIKIEIVKEGELVESVDSVKGSYSIPEKWIKEETVYQINLLNKAGNIIESKTFMTDDNLVEIPTNLSLRVVSALKLVKSGYTGGDINILMNEIPEQFQSNPIIQKLKLYGLIKSGSIYQYNKLLEN